MADAQIAGAKGDVLILVIQGQRRCAGVQRGGGKLVVLKIVDAARRQAIALHFERVAAGACRAAALRHGIAAVEIDIGEGIFGQPRAQHHGVVRGAGAARIAESVATVDIDSEGTISTREVAAAKDDGVARGAGCVGAVGAGAATVDIAYKVATVDDGVVPHGADGAAGSIGIEVAAADFTNAAVLDGDSISGGRGIAVVAGVAAVGIYR